MYAQTSVRSTKVMRIPALTYSFSYSLHKPFCIFLVIWYSSGLSGQANKM